MRAYIRPDGTYLGHDDLRAGTLTQAEQLVSIEGAQDVVNHFGHWESCHDAEVLEIQIRHTDTCLLSLYAYGRVEGANAGWIEAILTFSLRGLSNLSLEGYFQQNQLGGVTFQRIPEGLRMMLWGIHGTEGWIEARSISVAVYPMALSSKSRTGLTDRD
jgi:hypothetical protein